MVNSFMPLGCEGHFREYSMILHHESSAKMQYGSVKMVKQSNKDNKILSSGIVSTKV